jgi:hypothetical protein
VTLGFDTLDGLTRGSVTDVVCPLCGPLRTARANRVRKVLRLYRDEPDLSVSTARVAANAGGNRAVDAGAYRRIEHASSD